ncbi:MAG: chemotaxis protein CheA [Opitutus sp.]|nr:chemotaxis protein CheA [Opitutus sp.]
MSFAPESFQPLDDLLSRLATESIFAQPGRDDGLIPSYSLLGEMRDLCASEPVLAAAVRTVHGELDQLLDAAQPFDTGTLQRLREFIGWLPNAMTDAKAGRTPREFVRRAEGMAIGGSVAAPVDAETPSDVLLELNLGENQELLIEFHAEAVDHLQQIEAALLVLDQQADNPEALNSIFRSFHTIKGNAGFLGLVPMQSLAHEVESLLDLARNRELSLTPAIITEILRSRDALQLLTQQIAVALEKGQLPSSVVPVSHLIRAVKLLASSNAPTPGAVAETSAPVALPAATMEIPVPSSSASVEPTAAVASVAAANAIEAHAATKQTSGGQTVRVNTEKLDSLMDVVGELVIVQSQLIESARGLSDDGSPLHRNVAQLSRIAKELQHTAMSLRMIPIKPTFQKMERLSRDLARNFGKKVHFQVSGEDTELDRTVVEEIADPMVHMVRNALDHGLELPEQRVASGKPEQGTVHLLAYHQGSNIVVELQDDGRGIDPDRIFAKAVEKGIIAANATLTREEIYALIFAPGFSTAEKVTAVSGRGVGMDVVKRNIDKLRGKIEISSEIGKGSTFKIKLPLTMAIIDGLVVRVGTDRFILPSTSVQMAMRPPKDSITTVHGTGEVLELRGKILPLHRLHRRFGIPADAMQPWEGIVVLVEHSGRVSALLVDEMVSKQEVVIKNLGAFMQGLPGVAGGAILGDGNIALILDPASLLQASAA